MRGVKEPICLDAGKKEYQVKELELGVACYREYAEALKRRHGGLAEAIREREAGTPKK